MNTYRGFNISLDINIVPLSSTGEINDTLKTEYTQVLNSSRFQSKLSPVADFVIGCYLLIVCVLSILLNVLVILTVLRRRRCVSPLEIYVINMAVVDLCPTVLAFPSTSASAFNHGWILGDTGCSLSGFSVYFFGIVGITNLTVMSIMRYIVTCQHKSDMVNRRFVLLTLIPVYGNGLIWCFTPLVGWGRYGPESSGISCALEWHHLPLSYVITIFLTGFLMPVAIMIFCYSCIIREVYITQKGTQMIRKRMDIYMIKMTIMMTLCFLVAWTPYAVVAFLATEPWSQEIPVTLSVASSFLAKSSSFYNPIVYVFTVKRFRREVIEVLRCYVTKDTNATMATNFNLNEVKRPLDNQKESEFLLSDIHNKSRSEPSTDVRGSKDPDDNDHNQNDQDQNDQEQNNQECYDQEEATEETEQTRSLLVVSQVHESKDLALSTSLYDMPYMGPHIKGTLSGGPSVDKYNDIAMGNIVKKDTRVVLI